MAVARILLFAGLREQIASASIALELPEDCDVAILIDALVQRHPQQEQLWFCSRVAIGDAFVDGSFTVTDGIEIAIIPPVSGG